MRRFYVDASVFIRLSKIGHAIQLAGLDGEVVVPGAVAGEILADRDSRTLVELSEDGIIEVGPPDELIDHLEGNEALREAAQHLGEDEVTESSMSGDIALLALGLADDSAVVVTDDKPLRKTCKALGVPVSGSIGVVIAAVERGDLEPKEAKDALVSMDEVGARISARLLRKAERLIDEAMGPGDG